MFQTYNFYFNIMTNVAKVISIDWWQKLCRWLPPLQFATALNSSVCHNFHFPKTVAAAFHRKRHSHQKHRFSKLSFPLSSQQRQLFAIKKISIAICGRISCSLLSIPWQESSLVCQISCCLSPCYVTMSCNPKSSLKKNPMQSMIQMQRRQTAYL